MRERGARDAHTRRNEGSYRHLNTKEEKAQNHQEKEEGKNNNTRRKKEDREQQQQGRKKGEGASPVWPFFVDSYFWFSSSLFLSFSLALAPVSFFVFVLPACFSRPSVCLSVCSYPLYFSASRRRRRTIVFFGWLLLSLFSPYDESPPV
jgi:hypothetical protein